MRGGKLLRVSEVYQSIQGEGPLQGAVTSFVRFAGCMLVCSHCNVRYAQGVGDSVNLTASNVKARLLSMDRSPRHICLTGGEPLLQPYEEMESLLHQLSALPCVETILIKTSGAMSIRALNEFRSSHLCMGSKVRLSVDYKLPSSEMSQKMILSNYPLLSRGDMLRMICSGTDDAEAGMEFLRKHLVNTQGRPIVYFQAIGGQPDPHIAEEVLDPSNPLHEILDIRFGVQLNEVVWPHERGK